MIPILITGATHFSKFQLAEIGNLGFDVTFIEQEQDEILFDISKFEIVICNSLFIFHDILQFISLKFIQLTSAGYDRLPMEYISSKGIKVKNAKGVYSTPISEFVIGRIIEIYKHIRTFNENQRKHIWEKIRDLDELSEKKAMIIGFGDIGKTIARKLQAFDVEINAVDIREPSAEELESVSSWSNLNSFKNALPEMDIVIIAAPSVNSTYHLFNEKTLMLMHNESILVNISRGSLLDLYALEHFIKQGKFLGVVLDVFEEEPLNQDSLLWDYPKVYISPHNAFVSKRNIGQLFNCALDNLMLYQKSIENY